MPAPDLARIFREPQVATPRLTVHVPRSTPAGYSFLELVATLVIVGVVLSLAVPAFGSHMHRLRVTAAVNRYTADLYRARSVAARRGERLVMRFRPPTGCAAAYVLEIRRTGEILDSVELSDRYGRVCMTSNARNAMSINSRGQIVGSPRTIRAALGRHSDSITVSIAGRVYRW